MELIKKVFLMIMAAGFSMSTQQMMAMHYKWLAQHTPSGFESNNDNGQERDIQMNGDGGAKEGVEVATDDKATEALWEALTKKDISEAARVRLVAIQDPAPQRVRWSQPAR